MSLQQRIRITSYNVCYTKLLRRKSSVVALGGGVVGDLAGFVAASYMRGVNFIQMPTTILAHDSSVGGKVAVNHRLAKNMIGAFYQPEMVLYDVSSLQTLPDREVRAGLSEMVKHGLIWDQQFADWCGDHAGKLLSRITSYNVCYTKLLRELARRQKGYGRGRRMQIEKDIAAIVGGVRHGYTTGAPVAVVVENNDWTHWRNIMNIEPIEGTDEEKRRVHRPRPGHADLNGGLKYDLKDLRNVLERSSARETAVRVAVGAIAKQFLGRFGIKIGGQVKRIGEIEAPPHQLSLDELIEITEQSSVRVADKATEKKMEEYIDKIKSEGDSIGGIVECIVEGVPVGLGSHVQYDRKLDGRIAQAVMSINAFKGVEIGIGFEAGTIPGSQVHDEILYSEDRGYYRASNRLGGFEGGMTNGMPIVVRGVMKPSYNFV